MTEDARRPVVIAELALAEQTLKEADALGSLDLLLGGMARLYFSAFHLACALLASKSIEAKSHRGVHTLIGLHFVKSGELEAEHQQTLARLETWRDRADYSTGFVADRKLFDTEREAYRRLHARVIELLRAGGLVQ